MAEVNQDIASVIAHLPGVHDAVLAVAEALGARAEATLEQHRDKGDSKITVTKGTKTDAFVSLDDQGGYPAAAAIEYGGANHDGIHAITQLLGG